MVIHPVCGATKALIRRNANHMGWQVGHWCGLKIHELQAFNFLCCWFPWQIFVPQNALSFHCVDKIWTYLFFKESFPDLG